MARAYRAYEYVGGGVGGKVTGNMVVYYEVIVVVVDMVVRLGLVASVVGGDVGIIAFIVDCGMPHYLAVE